MTSFSEKLKVALENIALTRKTSFQWTRDNRFDQPYFTFDPAIDMWAPVQDKSRRDPDANSSVDEITVLSWNVDFMLALPNQRMQAALDYLKGVASSNRRPLAIFLQEMLVSDLKVIQAQKWVQQHFNLTDLDHDHWESGWYGTCTLVSKKLPILDVFRVHYSQTEMQRDGLFVDVRAASNKTVRLCNTHLESLVADPPLRPRQLEIAAPYLHDSAVNAGILAGDLNAIQPFDRALHSNNALKDAYLELGGTEDSDDGFTWGQQAPTYLRRMYGCSRMDKILFCGDLKLLAFNTCAADVEVASEHDKRFLIEDSGTEKAWVTDHLGIQANFEIIRD